MDWGPTLVEVARIAAHAAGAAICDGLLIETTGCVVSLIIASSGRGATLVLLACMG